MPPCCPAGKVPPRLPLGHPDRDQHRSGHLHFDAGTAQSSAQRLDVNQATTLANVPVVYMSCNAAAFEVGDRVIVEFQANDWKQPRVIGFVDYPKACAGGALYCIPADNDALLRMVAARRRWRRQPDQRWQGLDRDYWQRIRPAGRCAMARTARPG